MAMPARRASCGLRNWTTLPSMRISPALGGWAPAMIFISVLLPAPFAPSRQCTSPRRMRRDASCRALTRGGKTLLTPPTSNTGGGAARTTPPPPPLAPARRRRRGGRGGAAAPPPGVTAGRPRGVVAGALGAHHLVLILEGAVARR